MSYTDTGAIAVVRTQIGYRESGTNLTKYNDWLGTIPGYPHGGRGYPWCQSFQSWVASKAGGRANIDYPKTAGCEVAVGWFRSRGRLHGSPKVGDQVFYGPGGGTHVELVVKVTASSIVTIGGNTSGSMGGTYWNGDGVYQKTVSRSSSRIYGYGRPAYSGAGSSSTEGDPMLGLKKGDTGEPVKALQEMIKAAGQGAALGSAGSDGTFGAATAEALRQVRLSVGSTAAQKAGAGDRVDAWAYSQLHSAVARHQSKVS